MAHPLFYILDSRYIYSNPPHTHTRYIYMRQDKQAKMLWFTKPLSDLYREN